MKDKLKAIWLILTGRGVIYGCELTRLHFNQDCDCEVFKTKVHNLDHDSDCLVYIDARAKLTLHSLDVANKHTSLIDVG